MTRKRKSLIAVGVFAGLMCIAVLLVLLRPRPEITEPVVEVPLVRVVPARTDSTRMMVSTQGTVTPFTEIDLVTEVAGKIQGVSPKFVAGGFFRKGDVLVTIDPRDYRNNVTSAEATVARAQQALVREQAEAEQAARDWAELNPDVAPTDLALRKPQLAEARAELKAAQAQLATANLALDRTRLRAPFDGRVRAKAADLGQYLNPGQSVGRIFATDLAEVRLPLTDRQVAALAGDSEREGFAGAPVTLIEQAGGAERRWTARIVRTEGVVDEQNRVIYAVARLEDPYARGPRQGEVLRIGQFVAAQIEGRMLTDVVTFPRPGLRDASLVLTVDADSRLHFRTVDVARTTPAQVWVSGGIGAGERVIVSPLDNPVEGMQVEVLEDGAGAARMAGEPAVAAQGG